ncbi:DNA (cytosine-5)-methyltransferase 1 [Murinocardiopsis flavida]|uniref:DNA (cytosine-5-)-methyltransferase n=1 Tax=Murinocardiopsis flavida TaxID=645275 RepID=A0A2P8DFR3_9ACTN|nr:DNA cytosine methyltransferase [Murinocardiopsis flavida]PSK96055.1 DNA (cytosine-5)-methyltransferase 1 [Murinocardiopsis flavida]
MTLTLLDEFCGLGGSTAGAVAVPGVRAAFAANHNPQALESHQANHPETEHWCGDVQKVNVADTFPRADLFWSSPACPDWTDAKGVKRTFDTANQLALWKEEPSAEEMRAMRSRALMEEVVIYLRAMHRKGAPVLAGVVENVVQCRRWAEWDRWVREIRALGYAVRAIALNSMHARGRRSPRCPQSRDRLYVAYWRTALGRAPDWDKWLRPRAHCPACDATVDALQVFKKPGADMGRYRQQYLYRCPRAACRHQAVEPAVLPAAAAIDWSVPGTRIGDRPRTKKAPDGLTPKTLARIRAGLERYARPITLEAAGHTFERRPGVRTRPVDRPVTTQTTTATKALAAPPLLVPAGGTWRTEAIPVDAPMPARTTRESDGIAVPPFIAELRGGACDARPVTEALGTVTASGNHHGLVHTEAAVIMRNNTARGDAAHLSTPVSEPLRALTAAGHQSLVRYDPLLVPYYRTGTAHPADEPLGALSTRDRYGLAEGRAGIDLDDVLFRMLTPREIQAAMAFTPDYRVLAEKQGDQVRLLGNAVTPPVSEVLISALVEAITGEALTPAV